MAINQVWPYLRWKSQLSELSVLEQPYKHHSRGKKDLPPHKAITWFSACASRGADLETQKVPRVLHSHEGYPKSFPEVSACFATCLCMVPRPLAPRWTLSCLSKTSRNARSKAGCWSAQWSSTGGDHGTDDTQPALGKDSFLRWWSYTERARPDPLLGRWPEGHRRHLPTLPSGREEPQSSAACGHSPAPGSGTQSAEPGQDTGLYQGATRAMRSLLGTCSRSK